MRVSNNWRHNHYNELNTHRKWLWNEVDTKCKRWQTHFKHMQTDRKKTRSHTAISNDAASRQTRETISEYLVEKSTKQTKSDHVVCGCVHANHPVITCKWMWLAVLRDVHNARPNTSAKRHFLWPLHPLPSAAYHCQKAESFSDAISKSKICQFALSQVRVLPQWKGKWIAFDGNDSN